MGGWDRGTPWRQGSVLTDEAASELGLVESLSSLAVCVIVLSHDCDLAQGTDKEPYVEVIAARKIGEPDGKFTHGKNPRQLHLAWQQSGATLYVELQAKDKQFVPKERLANYSPNASVILQPKNRSVLQQWLAARYQRTGFPEEFERSSSRRFPRQANRKDH